MENFELDTFERAFRIYGERAQITMVFEEMAELQKALCKFLRGKEDIRNIAEEIADVQIMTDQMQYLFRCQKEVETFRQMKIARLAERLDSEEERTNE